MIIEGFYDPIRKYFYVQAKVYLGGKPYAVNLMVDTGASVTALLDRDALRIFGNKLSKLKESRKGLVGIGGFADTYYVENVKIELIDSKNPELKYTITLNKLYVVTHHKHFRGEEWKKVSQLPSILGRDILFKASKIIFDFSTTPPKLKIEFP